MCSYCFISLIFCLGGDLYFCLIFSFIDLISSSELSFINKALTLFILRVNILLFAFLFCKLFFIFKFIFSEFGKLTLVFTLLSILYFGFLYMSLTVELLLILINSGLLFNIVKLPGCSSKSDLTILLFILV